jgi:hypothetical protein
MSIDKHSKRHRNEQKTRQIFEHCAKMPIEGIRCAEHWRFDKLLAAGVCCLVRILPQLLYIFNGFIELRRTPEIY